MSGGRRLGREPTYLTSLVLRNVTCCKSRAATFNQIEKPDPGIVCAWLYPANRAIALHAQSAVPAIRDLPW